MSLSNMFGIILPDLPQKSNLLSASSDLFPSFSAVKKIYAGNSNVVVLFFFNAILLSHCFVAAFMGAE